MNGWIDTRGFVLKETARGFTLSWPIHVVSMPLDRLIFWTTGEQ